MSESKFPQLEVLQERARKACLGTRVNAADLVRWLIRQGDPDWCTVPAIRRWAKLIESNGFPPETPQKERKQ